MKFNLKLLLLSSGLVTCLVGSSLKIATAQYIQNIQNSPTQNNPPIQNNSGSRLSSSVVKTNKQKELNAFYRSNYDYWDARVLAEFWRERVDESKARIGHKIIRGDLATLEQYLVDARVKALEYSGKSSHYKPSPYVFYSDSSYDYDDAVKLAKFWGDRTPYEAKLRIERNLILGQPEVVQKALRQAR